jgi:UDP-2,4-diacetamido-2,4,6-trideoxy-beta-L-altropyranose hydrolase
MKRNSIVFFCNAGADDGLGHLMRCLSFADAVKGVKKSSIYFFSNDFEGIVKDRVTSNGYKFKEITNSSGNQFIQDLSDRYTKLIQWIIIDLKTIPPCFIDECRKISRVLHFDDDICRSFNSNIIINNHISSNKDCYQSNLKSKLLIGSKFNAVNELFFKVGLSNKNNKHILITLGGEDPEDLTSWLIKGLSDILSTNRVVIIVGPANPNLENIKKNVLIHVPHAQVIFSPKNLSKYMIDAVLAITAGGITCYELAAAKVPQCMIALEEHQKSLINGFVSNNAAALLGFYDNIHIDKVKKIVNQVLKNKNISRSISENASNLVPKKGLLNIIKEMGIEKII